MGSSWIPKEVQKPFRWASGWVDDKFIQGTKKHLIPRELYKGFRAPPAPEIPPTPPPESIDVDALKMRDRSRRRARVAGTIRTSPAGAPYSAAPKSLLGT